ncbi:MAG: flagellar export chaperone FliS [Firmicutes bacterium]|nr:flagellar export chaperone FliS [Bacillota bacterium]
MQTNANQEYRRQMIMNMTPQELLLTLLDELKKDAKIAELRLEREEFPEFEEAIDRCKDIISYLDETLDRQYEISHELHRMYEYFDYQLIRIKIGRNKEALVNLRPMFEELQDAFKEADKNNAAASGK